MGDRESPSLSATPSDGAAVSPRWVVAVGSSAGGIEALSALLEGLEPQADVALVVAQHLSASHSSPLAEILGRGAPLRVVEVRHGEQPSGGCVHVTPAGVDVAIADGAFVLTPADEASSPRPSIDGLMRSVARKWGDHAVGIVLSGTGEDGAAGIEAIKAAGGVTIAQDPLSARFSAMPDAAIATGSVDLVAPPAEVGALLRRTCSEGAARGGPAVERWTEAQLVELVDAVRSATGVDFAEYKSGTLERQIARRQAIVGIAGPADYLALVGDDPEEARSLMRRMFVSVTAFFRDPAAWDALRRQVEALVARTPRTHQFRVWVPGCATGEEAYSVAMLFADALGRPADLDRRLRLFASDLDEAALEVARRGRYEASAVADLPPEMADAFTEVTAAGLEVARSLRECIVFARHDVTLDPPFPRLDLISLRNTLIYFQPALQERLLRLCSFALNPSGMLFLGEAEGVSGAGDLFAPLDPDHPIYQRVATAALGPFPTRPTVEQAIATTPPAARGSERSRRQVAVLNDVLRAWAPPLLVLNDQDEVVQVVGDVSPWCWVADGPYTSQVTTLMRDDLQPVVSSLLLRLHHGEGTSHSRRVATADGTVEVTARRLDRSDEVFAVISFDAAMAASPTPPGVGRPSAVGDPPTVAGMIPEAEYLEAHEALQETIEDLTAANEEMQALNEEFQATSEELQASSEEVSASNEELSTLNEELQVRTAELETRNLDLENIQRSLDTGIILLDEQLCVRTFNPLAVRLFALIESDLGKPLVEVATTARVPGLAALLGRVAASGGSELIEVSGETVDYLVRLQPYLDGRARQQGVTLTVTDVSSIAEIRRSVEHSLAELEQVVESIDELLWMTDPSGAIVLIGPQVEELYGVERQAALADPALLESAVHPDDLAAVGLLRRQEADRWRAEFRIVRPDGSIRWVSSSSRRVPSLDGSTLTIRTALDVTDRHEAEERSTVRLHLFESVFNTEAFGVVAVDADGAITTCNATFATMAGATPDLLAGRALETLVSLDPLDAARSGSWLSAVGPLVGGDHRLLSASPGARWVMLDVRPVPPLEGLDAFAIVIVDEVTELRETEERLTRGAHIDEQTGINNRAWFHSRLAEELARSERSGRMAALASIDLDGFKAMNDQFGHATGDRVLQAVADRLRSIGRRQDVVGRIGGDEFALLIGDIEGAQEVDPIMERVLACVREPIDIGAGHASLTASVGVALSPSDGHDAATLLHNADVAMYHAKGSGRDCWAFFSPEMHSVASARAEQRQLLADAIRSRHFTMRYQPIVAVADGTIFAAESLVRWQRGEELLDASSFIDLAEETYQLRSLGHLVMELVATDLRRMADHPALSRLPIGINLSVSQLEEQGLADLLLAWDLAGGFDRLIVEVTESALLERKGPGISALSLLRRLGATICIDDFGSGYANLGQLEVARPEMIKFAQDLLARARSDPDGRALVSSAVDLVRAVGAKVVFEGVETEADLELATSLGADWVQGYLIAEPMPIDDLSRWIAERGGPSSPTAGVEG